MANKYTIEIRSEIRAGLEIEAETPDEATKKAMLAWGKDDIYDYGTPEVVECSRAVVVKTHRPDCSKDCEVMPNGDPACWTPIGAL